MPFINKAGCECLNESDEHGFDNCLRKDMTFLESDCDEQVTECLGLVEIISICVHTRFHLMVSCLSFPDDHFFLTFYNHLCPLTLSPHPLSSFVYASCAAENHRSLGLSGSLGGAFTILKSFCSFLSCLHTFYPPKWDIPFMSSPHSQCKPVVFPCIFLQCCHRGSGVV